MTYGILNIAGVGTSNLSPLSSQRNVVNMLYPNGSEYAFINHVQWANDSVSFNSSTWNTNSWTDYIDARGWPNPGATSAIRTAAGFQGEIVVPNSSDYTGTYTITWDGDGQIAMQAGTWTVSSGTNYTEDSNGTYSTTTSGAGKTKIVVSLAGMTAAPNSIQWKCLKTDHLNPNVGNYLRNLQIYRTGDEARLQSGKYFRLPWLQKLVDLNPGAIRFMNWIGGNNDPNCRWENRSKPDIGGWSGHVNYCSSPNYKLDTTNGPSYSTPNQYTLAAAVPTSGLTQTTPSFMQHGEVAIGRLAISPTRIPNYNGGGNGNNLDVTGITKGANGRVTTSLAHGFQTGDTIFHRITGANQMIELNLVPCVITVINSTQYDTNINTSTFTTWTVSNTAIGCANQFITLQVGSGNDRTAYPILFDDGASYIAEFGPSYLLATGLYPFSFDKNMVGSQTTAGVKNYGVWLVQAGGNSSTGAHDGGAPIELITQAVIEANLLAQSQGKNNPMHLWMNIPHRGLMPTDTDYSTGSAWARNAVNVALNGSTVNSVTYPGLKSITGPSLLIEYSNETWNGSVKQRLYTRQFGLYRLGVFEDSSGHAFRSTSTHRDIKAAFPSETRLKIVQGGQAVGYSSGNINGLRTLGTTSYFADATVTAQSWGAPYNWFDAFCYAPYIDPPISYDSNAASGYTDDNARWRGADNSGTLAITGTCPGTTTFTTTAVSGGPPVVGQVLVGTGISNANQGTMIIAASGSGNVWTLTLNQVATITAATVNSPSNGGGNYIGAQNQAAAIQHLVDACTTWLGASDGTAQLDQFCQVSNPTAGFDYTYTSAMAALGKTAIQYEGGFQMDPLFGGGGPSQNPLGANNVFYGFVTAIYSSTAWKTAQTNYWNSRATLTGAALPAFYYWAINQASFGAPNIRWAYATPDTYSGGVEGAALSGNPCWAGFGTRNQALTI